MIQPEELERAETYRIETVGSESAPGDSAMNSKDQTLQGGREFGTRAGGSPLPAGPAGRPLSDSQSFRGVTPPPPGRALAQTPAPSSSEDHPGLQRAIGMLKQAFPFVQRLLPLIDGNIATAVASLMSTPANNPGPAPKVDLAPVQSQLAHIQVQHEELRAQFGDQTAQMKRVEDQLEMVREATDRNTLEQQELIEDLKAVGVKVNLFALILCVLLLVSIGMNLVLFLHIKQVLP